MGGVKNDIYLLKSAIEVFAKDEKGKYYYLGLTNDGAVRRSVNQELIRSGLDGRVVGTLSTDENWEIEVTTGLHYKNLMEIQLGADFADYTGTIQEVSEDSSGEIVTSSKAVSGTAIDVEPNSFGKVLEDMQLHTLAYDPVTEKPVADVYWIFSSVIPDSNFEQVLGLGANNVQSTKFTPRIPSGETDYGKYIIIPREDAASGYGTIVVHGVKSTGDTLYVDVLTKRLGEYTIEPKTVTNYTSIDPAYQEVELTTKGETKMVVFTYST